ncbi:MAG: homocysteine S-methyltransferase family protein [Subdoligranulum sp.]
MLDISPISELLAGGHPPFEDACAQFAEMVRAGAAAGADLVFLETMTDLYELKAAILAAKENCDLPVFTSMSFEARGRTFTGCTVESYGITAAGLGADAVGINCSLGCEIRAAPAALPCGARRYAGVCQAQCGPAEPGRAMISPRRSLPLRWPPTCPPEFPCWAAAAALSRNPSAC